VRLFLADISREFLVHIFIVTLFGLFFTRVIFQSIILTIFLANVDDTICVYVRQLFLVDISQCYFLIDVYKNCFSICITDVILLSKVRSGYFLLILIEEAFDKS